jgi:hypothetical protein
MAGAEAVTLGQKQRLFMRLLPRLIDHAHSLGFELSGGDLYRDPRVHGEIGIRKGYGHPKSAHKYRLAIDLNLFFNGQFLTDSEAHRPMGEWWEQQHPLCRWGGRFNDGNHYAITHEGVM